MTELKNSEKYLFELYLTTSILTNLKFECFDSTEGFDKDNASSDHTPVYYANGNASSENQLEQFVASSSNHPVQQSTEISLPLNTSTNSKWPSAHSTPMIVSSQIKDPVYKIYKALVPQTVLSTTPMTSIFPTIDNFSKFRQMLRRIDHLPDDMPEQLVRWNILAEAIEMNKIDSTYSIGQYSTFIEKNQQKVSSWSILTMKLIQYTKISFLSA